MCNFKKSRKFIEPEIWHIASGNTYTIYDLQKVYLSHNKELKLVKLKYNGNYFIIYLIKNLYGQKKGQNFDGL